MKHPHSGLYALTGPFVGEYLEAMGVAARYAWLNRVVLGKMVRQTLREVLQCDDSRMVVDAIARFKPWLTVNAIVTASCDAFLRGIIYRWPRTGRFYPLRRAPPP